ncbi:MAG: UvrD-helicase domain-containing protein, partial [Paracoccaceae bacterium]
ARNRFARACLSRYDAGKRARGLLDFDDLIEMAGGLLGDARVADWVLYRLDGGIDHILVDEAQDISPAQWRVIDAVSREFFAGEGARRAERTVFAVGDFKQSIYSFQGAEPAIFDDMRRAYASRAKGSGKKFRNCELLHSFRSAPPILELVDRIFSGPERGGVSGEIRHLAAHGGKPGRIDVWPFVEPDEKAPPEPWYQPVDMPPAREPARRISGAVAAEISGWLKAGRILPGQNRPIRAGDILILVRSRGALFRGVIKELKERGVEVAGADKFRIGQELAVMDLLSVLRFLSTPSDDLSLAEALRSPVFGLGEADLFSLAHGRAGTLWQALEKAEAEFPETLAMLRDLFRHADYERPYEMLERVLTQHGARARILARMGGESADALDELLVQALAYERTEAPSLTGFIEWMEASEVEVNRQTDALTDRVRVMTVHGAKGLGSPIVILPDTLPLRNRKPSPVIRIGDGLAAWRGPGDQPDSLQAEADRQAALAAEEEMRLLYVALTRAEHWLLVCGGGQARYRPGSWYERISVAVAGMGAARAPAPDGIDGESLSLARDWTAGPVDGGPPGESPQIAELPDWAVSPAPEVAARPAPVSPSGLGGEHALPGETDVTSEEAARRRGSLLHLLLQALPCLPAPDRRDAALRILANAGAEPSRDDPEALAAEAMAVVGAPELAAVFAEGALTEVPVTAELPELGGRRISGRIDRLLVSGNEILAVDFKSNRVIPRTAEEVPEGILRQMGAYRAALGGIWPDRSVRTAILWTASRSLMALPGEIVAAALARAGAP